MAEFLKPLGYATGQFGKNHLGDRDEHLPTAHGFDEFFGILYHLNAGEYVEQYDFPKDPEVTKRFAQRGVVHSWAHADGKQKVQDKGPFGRERQRTLDSEILVESKRFITEAAKAGKPFFVWHNTTRMHYRTNLSPKYEGKSGYGVYADGMMEMDDTVGELLTLLDDLAWLTTRWSCSRPTTVPRRTAGPMVVTSRSAARRASVGTKALPGADGRQAAGRHTGRYVHGRVHVHGGLGPHHPRSPWSAGPEEPTAQGTSDREDEVQGAPGRFDQSDLITGKGPTKRKEFYYFTETTLHGLRYGDWKFLFKKQDKWFNGVQDNMVTPIITNLKLDPSERFHEARGFDEWQENRSWTLAPANAQIGVFLKSLKDYSPRQASIDFNIDEMLHSMSSPTAR